MFEFNEEAHNFDPLKDKPKNDDALTNDFVSNPIQPEFHVVQDNEEVLKKSTKVAKMVTAVLTVASVIAILGVGLFTSGVSAPNIKASILSLWATATEIGYVIELPENLSEDVSIVISNSYISREASLVGGQNEGVIEGLAAGGTYTLKIVCHTSSGDATLHERKVRTKDGD